MTQTCTQCQAERPVREIMGGSYYVLGYCGHVQAIEEGEA